MAIRLEVKDDRNSLIAVGSAYDQRPVFTKPARSGKRIWFGDDPVRLRAFELQTGQGFLQDARMSFVEFYLLPEDDADIA